MGSLKKRKFAIFGSIDDAPGNHFVKRLRVVRCREAAAALSTARRAPTTAPAHLSAWLHTICPMGTSTPTMKAAVIFAIRKLRSCGAKIAVPRHVPVPNASSPLFRACSGQSRDNDRGKNESQLLH